MVIKVWLELAGLCGALQAQSGTGRQPEREEQELWDLDLGWLSDCVGAVKVPNMQFFFFFSDNRALNEINLNGLHGQEGGESVKL